MRSSVDFWYRRISRRATVPGLYRCGFLTPPVAAPAVLDAVFRAALVATTSQHMSKLKVRGDALCFRGAFPPVDFRAVCLVRAIVDVWWGGGGVGEVKWL